MGMGEKMELRSRVEEGVGVWDERVFRVCVLW